MYWRNVKDHYYDYYIFAVMETAHNVWNHPQGIQVQEKHKYNSMHSDELATARCRSSAGMNCLEHGVARISVTGNHFYWQPCYWRPHSLFRFIALPPLCLMYHKSHRWCSRLVDELSKGVFFIPRDVVMHKYMRCCHIKWIRKYQMILRYLYNYKWLAK